jgi:hypothetical protein
MDTGTFVDQGECWKSGLERSRASFGPCGYCLGTKAGVHVMVWPTGWTGEGFALVDMGSEMMGFEWFGIV